ncbi:MAG: outer membrane beta-barrel protein [Flavobacteriales bacterium]|nr:outer membrane beta-barrel protein [Flavobacteriales bacterium]
MIGARGQVSNTWMFNKNLSDNGDLVDYKGTFTGGGGISVIQYLNETVGVEVGLGVNTVAQRTQGEFETFFGDDIDYVYETSVDYLEITALFKALSDGGSYFEVGPMIMLNQSETENVIDISDPDLEDDIFGTQTQRDNRVAEDFSKTLLFGVIGFGVNFDVADNLMAGVGLRLAYSFSDSVEQVTEDQYNEGDPDLGWYSTIAHTDAPLDEGEYDPVTTNAAIAGLNIALYYTIGGN